MMYPNWTRYHITDDINLMERLFDQDNPILGGADTESTGLHIKRDKPFLIIFGWLIPGGDQGRVFTFKPTPENMKIFLELAKKLKVFIFHNTKYDLHMLKNIGYTYDEPNLVENMALARLSLEAVPAREGGDSLALKDLGVKYVHHAAGASEKMIKRVKEQILKERVKVLTAALKQFPIEGQFTATGRQQYWGKGAIEKFLKDPTKDLEDLNPEIREIWQDWQEEYGSDVTYLDIYKKDPEAMIRYAADDVITMMEFAKIAIPIVKERKQQSTLKRENKVIMPLFRMERVGIKVDRDYLKESRARVKKYIIEQRQKMYALAGDEINCGQHDAIKKVFYTKWGIELESSDKPALKLIMKNHEGEARRYAELIIELRTLEKWYSTYINRLLDISSYDGRFYTQISQCSAVSGRVGSDSQQYPKDAITDENGNELFHPRRCFTPTGNGYNSIWYCDLSQVELRVAANYTLLVSGGDLNLCRAYMPFKCTHYLTGDEFDPKLDIHIWNVKQSNGDSAWLDEEGNPWKPTDIHSETTKNAYPNVEVGSDEFKKKRGKGKSTNFLCLYGGSPGALAKTLDVPKHEAQALYDGYKKAFPHLDVYQQQVIKQHRKQGYVQNMFGRRYYLKDTNKSYKLANFLIQGSCADDMKRSITEVDELLKNYKSRMILTVHDEIQVEVWNGEEHLIPKILEIMGNVGWSLVPILCDSEYTRTTWYDKVEVKL